MTKRIYVLSTLLMAVTLVCAALMTAAQNGTTPPRPQGPCDIYGAAGTPCVAAHSTTRALSAAYNGQLYQVKRDLDDRTLDIGVVQPSAVAGVVRDTTRAA